MTNTKRILRITLKIALRTVATLLLLFLLIVALLNIPAVQTFITEKITTQLREQLGTEISIAAVKIAIPKTVLIEEIFLADKQSDTLLYINTIKINISLFQLLRQEINVQSLEIDKLTGNVFRGPPGADFNFGFILDAFAGDTTQAASEADKSANPWKVSADKIKLSSIDVWYRDETLGMDVRLNLGNLEISINKFDLDKPAIFIENLLLENTVAKLDQWEVEVNNAQTVSVQPDSASNAVSTFPDLELAQLEIANVKFEYNALSTDLSLEINAGRLKIKPELIDLSNQKLSFRSLEISNTKAFIALASDTIPISKSDDALQTMAPEEKSGLEIIPGWSVEMHKFTLDGVDFGYDDISTPKADFGIDYSHLLVENIILDAQDISLSELTNLLKIKKLSLHEQSGLIIEQLAFEAELTGNSAEINGLDFKTPESTITGDTESSFESWEQISENPGRTSVILGLDNSIVSTTDAFLIAGINPEDSIIKPYNNLFIKMDAQVSGTIDSLKIENLGLSFFDKTLIRAKGNLYHLTDSQNLTFDITLDTLSTIKKDLFSFLDTAYFSGFKIPDTIFLKLAANGSKDSIQAEIDFRSNFGNLLAEGFYYSSGISPRDTFNIKLDTDSLNISKILADTTLGKVNLSVAAFGSGLTSDSISGKLAGTINSAWYNNYNYNSLNFGGILNGRNYEASLISDDPNLDFKLDAFSNTDSAGSRIKLEIDLKKANLFDLGFAADQTTITSQFSLDGKYVSLEESEANITIENTEVTRNGNMAKFKTISLHPVFTPSGTFLDLNSGFLNLNINSNIPLDEMAEVWNSAAKKYLGLPDSLTLQAGKNLDFMISVNLPQEFRSVYLPGLKELVMDSIRGKYRSDNNILEVDLNAPKISFEKMKVENLHLKMNGMNDSLIVSSGFSQLFYDTLFVGALNISEQIKDGFIGSTISLQDLNGNSDYLFENTIAISDSGYKISFAENGLIMNKQAWLIPPENFLEINDSGLIAGNFVFSLQQQQIGLITTHSDQTFVTTDFELSNLLNVIKIPGERRPFKGKLNTKISVPTLEKFEGIQAEIGITDFYFLDSLIGDINFRINETIENLDLFFNIKNNLYLIQAKGSIGKAEFPQPLNLTVNIDIEDLSKLAVFSLGTLSELEGRITGKAKIEGNIDNPQINGFLDFQETRMKIKSLNFLAYIADERLQFKNEGIWFDSFTILDEQNNKLIINGDIQTHDYSHLAFDLAVNSKGFQPVNSTRENNELFYGNLVIDSDLTIKGNSDLPVIDATITIQEGTDLTYVLPGSEIEIISAEGIVKFNDPTKVADTNFQALRSDYLSDSIISKVKGIDLGIKLKLNPAAKFTVIIDPYSGDYASVSGGANLNISVDPSGSQSVTGVFEVTDGIYQLSFYGLVKKTFAFQPGSSIAWSGSPMDANLNFTAKHIVRTQSTALISNETSEMTEAESNMFKQRLPYEVLLNLKGFLDNPEVSFGISLPEKYIINYPQIASKLTLLNSGNNESELNKQVFALLVTGSFIAENPFASTGGSAENFATTAARNSVNGILADQLNKISNRYIKGVDLNFGLTSYEDYANNTSQTRTELDVQVSKKLLNDRLTVEATGSFDLEGNHQYSSTSTSYTYGEFSATYDLTESGEYKLRAYRENAYDLFDGEITYSGLAFIIEKSFNSLFKRTKKTKENLPTNTEGLKSENPKIRD